MTDQEAVEFAELMRDASDQCPEAVPEMWASLRDYLIAKNASSPVPAIPCNTVRRMF